MNTLKQLWMCLEHDAVFSFYQKQIATNWALLPSERQQLYSANSDILPVIDPRSASDEESCDTNVRDVRVSELLAFDLLRSLNMPVLDSSVSQAVRGFCPTLSNHPLILKNLYHLHKSTNVLCDLQNPAQDVDILFAYFARIDSRYDPTSLSYIKQLPLFQTIVGKYSELCGKTIYLWPINFCHAGYQQWAEDQNVVFLSQDGQWRKLRVPHSILNGKSVSEHDI